MKHRRRAPAYLALINLAIAACGVGGGARQTPVGTGDGFSIDAVEKPEPIKCTPEAPCPSEQPHCSAAGLCLECLEDTHCSAGTPCTAGACQVCEPGALKCDTGDNVLRCNIAGLAFELIESCGASGTCAGGKCLECYPGTKTCDGNVSKECAPDGSGYAVLQDCDDSGTQCAFGVCLSPCSGDIKQNTNAGCQFFAVDLQNVQDGDSDAQNAQFAVIASNTSDSETAHVTLTRPDGAVDKASIPPMSLHKFELPPSWGVDDTMIGMNAFTINSTAAIIVYQFNPLSNEDEVFSNDASLLLPAPSLGKEYWVMSYGFQIPGADTPELPSFFTVVGSSELPTQVTFTVSAPTRAGGGVPALAPGQSHLVTLKQGEVLNVSAALSNDDLTGSHIVANGPVAVFAGHECPFTGQLCCCDHLEQQMIPVPTWGKAYLVTKTWERWNEKDYVRVLAAQDDTHVSVDPPIADVPVLKAGEYHTFMTDKHLEITADKPILVAQYLASSYEILGKPDVLSCSTSADCPAPFTCDPFGAFCVGPNCTNTTDCASGTTCEFSDLGTGQCAPIGDPAMILAIPREQFVKRFVFLTPDAYLHDYVNVIAPLNTGGITLDGQAIAASALVPIGGSEFGVFRAEVSDGVHQIESDTKIGIVVYGYDNDVSYGYPGGLGLVKLN